mmetsp:Transcript_35901/g.101009  ORF Transcript_35901/g.101009 Transcript_35901/m.101009 type:complete len:424 (+) Transcript_35901:185-1456(+)
MDDTDVLSQCPSSRVCASPRTLDVLPRLALERICVELNFAQIVALAGCCRRLYEVVWALGSWKQRLLLDYSSIAAESRSMLLSKFPADPEFCFPVEGNLRDLLLGLHDIRKRRLTRSWLSSSAVRLLAENTREGMGRMQMIGTATLREMGIVLENVLVARGGARNVTESERWEGVTLGESYAAGRVHFLRVNPASASMREDCVRKEVEIALDATERCGWEVTGVSTDWVTREQIRPMELVVLLPSFLHTADWNAAPMYDECVCFFTPAHTELETLRAKRRVLVPILEAATKSTMELPRFDMLTRMFSAVFYNRCGPGRIHGFYVTGLFAQSIPGYASLLRHERYIDDLRREYLAQALVFHASEFDRTIATPPAVLVHTALGGTLHTEGSVLVTPSFPPLQESRDLSPQAIPTTSTITPSCTIA